MINDECLKIIYLNNILNSLHYERANIRVFTAHMGQPIRNGRYRTGDPSAGAEIILAAGSQSSRSPMYHLFPACARTITAADLWPSVQCDS